MHIILWKTPVFLWIIYLVENSIHFIKTIHRIIHRINVHFIKKFELINKSTGPTNTTIIINNDLSI